MKRANLSGIFAAALIAVTIFTLASCSQDDEYYEDGLFTRADEMMTRTGEPEENMPVPILYYYLNRQSYTEYIFPSVELVHQVSCSIDISGSLTPEVSSHLDITDSIIYYNVEMKDHSFTKGSKFGRLGVIINYYIRFYDRRESIQAPDSTYREFFVPFDTITYMSNEAVVQPSV